MDNSFMYEAFAEGLARGESPSFYLKDVSFFEGWTKEEIKNLGLAMLGFVSYFRLNEVDLMDRVRVKYSSDFQILAHDMYGISQGDKTLLCKCTGYRKHI